MYDIVERSVGGYASDSGPQTLTPECSKSTSSTISPPTLPDAARRRLHATSPDAALKFTSSWHKLEKSTGPGRGRTLRDPLPHLQFLMALSRPSPPATMAPPPVPSTSRTVSVPSRANTPPQPAESSRSARPVEALPVIDMKGKTKAEVLKEWRTAQCTYFRWPKHDSS